MLIAVQEPFWAEPSLQRGQGPEPSLRRAGSSPVRSTMVLPWPEGWPQSMTRSRTWPSSSSISQEVCRGGSPGAVAAGGDDGFADEGGDGQAEGIVRDAQTHGLLVLQIPWHFPAGGQDGRVGSREHVLQDLEGGRVQVPGVAAEHFQVRAEDAHGFLRIAALQGVDLVHGLLPGDEAAQAEERVRGIGDDAVLPQHFRDALQVAQLGGFGVEREDHTQSRLPHRARPGLGCSAGSLEEALRQGARQGAAAFRCAGRGEPGGPPRVRPSVISPVRTRVRQSSKGSRWTCSSSIILGSVVQGRILQPRGQEEEALLVGAGVAGVAESQGFPDAGPPGPPPRPAPGGCTRRGSPSSSPPPFGELPGVALQGVTPLPHQHHPILVVQGEHPASGALEPADGVEAFAAPAMLEAILAHANPGAVVDQPAAGDVVGIGMGGQGQGSPGMPGVSKEKRPHGGGRLGDREAR